MNTPQPTYKVICARPELPNPSFDTREEAESFAAVMNAQMMRHFPALADDYRCTVEEIAE